MFCNMKPAGPGCELSTNWNSPIYSVNVATHEKTVESKNRINRGYLVVLKGRKVGLNYKP